MTQIMNAAVTTTCRTIESALHGNSAFEQVDENLYIIKQGSAYVMVSVVAWGHDKAMVRCAAQLVTGIQVPGELALQLLELNSHLRFGAFGWDPSIESVVFSHTLLGGKTLDHEEILATLRDVALIADEYDDKIVAKFGGQRMRDLIKDAAVGKMKRAHTNSEAY